MDTRARLREQRKKGWRGPSAFFGLGFGVGGGLGFSTCAGVSDGFWPVWATALVAYGLGGLIVLVYRWLATGRDRPGRS